MSTFPIRRVGAWTLWIGLMVMAMTAGQAVAATPFFPASVELPLGGEQPRVAIGADGTAVAVWMHGFRNGIDSGPGCCYNKEITAATGSALSGLWQTPLAVSTPGFSILPEVAVDGQGDVAAIWLNSYPQEGIDVSYRSAGVGEWQAPAEVSNPGERGEQGQIALKPNGDVIAAWAKLGEGAGASVVAEETAVRSAATGAWEPSREFALARHPQDFKLAIDARGDVFAAWVVEGAVEAAIQPFGSSSWQAPVRLSTAPGPGMSVRNLELAVSAGGDAALLWQISGNQCVPPRGRRSQTECIQPVTLWSSVRSSATGEWGTATAIPSAGGAREAQQPTSPIYGPARARPSDEDAEIAIDSRGDAIASWIHVGGKEAGIQVSIRPAATGAWQNPSTLAPSVDGFAYGARYLAVDAYGRALVAWRSAYGVIQGAVGSAVSGQWQEPVDVTPEGAGSVDEVHVAVDGAGDAAMLWSGSTSMQAITFNLSTGVPGYRPPRPLIADATLTQRRFRVLPSRRAGRLPTGTHFRFTVFPDAWVKVAIQKLTPGRRVGSKCLVGGDRLARANTDRCSLVSLITTLETRESAGTHTIAFSGAFERPRAVRPRARATMAKVPSHRRVDLKPGEYVAVLSAGNASGVSSPVMLYFAIVG